MQKLTNPLTQKHKTTITIILISLLCLTATNTYAELRTNMSADVVIGQADFTSATANQGGIGANTFYQPVYIFSDGKRLFISDYVNNRVLIYNSIPTSNNASADVVVGQPDFTSFVENQGNTPTPGPNTIYHPQGIFSDGKRLFIVDTDNNRVLIYNSIPTSNNASADVVVGQADFTSRLENQT
ncbi:MAG: hypothetical protein JSV93_00215, partial [Candidatus Omnitrophota bacterium]